jgi:hypothetical protein
MLSQDSSYGRQQGHTRTPSHDSNYYNAHQSWQSSSRTRHPGSGQYESQVAYQEPQEARLDPFADQQQQGQQGGYHSQQNYHELDAARQNAYYSENRQELDAGQQEPWTQQWRPTANYDNYRR